MPSFGTNSKRHLETCHEDIQKVLNEAINHYDFSVIWGHRGMEAQNKAYLEGNSNLEWPKSKHNSNPSMAVDIIPYPGGFARSNEEFTIMATHIFRAASVCGVPNLIWGGHWRTFKDLAHFELRPSDDL